MPVCTNPTLAVGLFNPNYNPNELLFNKFTSIIDWTPSLSTFLSTSYESDNIAFHYELQSDSAHYFIGECFMPRVIPLTIGKSHLKSGTFKQMLNERYCTPKHNLRKN